MHGDSDKSLVTVVHLVPPLNVCAARGCVRVCVCAWCRRKESDFDECVLTDGVAPLSLPPLPLQLPYHGWISRSSHLSYLFHTARTQHNRQVNTSSPESAAVSLFLTHLTHKMSMEKKNVWSKQNPEGIQCHCSTFSLVGTDVLALFKMITAFIGKPVISSLITVWRHAELSRCGKEKITHSLNF